MKLEFINKTFIQCDGKPFPHKKLLPLKSRLKSIYAVLSSGGTSQTFS